LTLRRRACLATLLAFSFRLSAAAGALSPAHPLERLAAGKELFEQHCGICHGLELPASQRLDRAAWEWVVEDMVGYGMTWLSPAQRELIVHYLAAEHGPP
jgi:mono/diheme cytochrome c family protein